MKSKITVLVVVVALVGVALSASAFTTATVDRSSTITVSSDSGSLIGLAPDADATMVTENADGQLAIDMSGTNGEGVNVDSTYNIGSSSDPKNVSAFSVTNNDGSARDLTFSYDAPGSDSTTDANVQFEVYDSEKTSLGTFSEESAALSLTSLAGGDVYYVTLTVSTTNSGTTDDLSGTLTIKAE